MSQHPVHNVYKSLFWGAFFAYLIAILLNMKSFQMWSQVQVLHEMGLQINLKSIYFHPHGLRYALVYPIYLVAELLNVSPDKILSLAVVGMCGVISFTLSHSFAMYQKVRNLWEIKFFVFAFFAVLSIFMNGRLIFGLCSYSILIYSFFLFEKQHDRKHHLQAACLVLVALFFSSISSGVAISFFAICFSTAFIYLVTTFKRGMKFNKLLACYMTTLFLLYTPIIFCLVNKNLKYFGNGYDAILSMTQHGTLSGLTHKNSRELSEPPPESENEGGNYVLFKVLCVGFSLMLLTFVGTYRWQLLRDPLLLFTTYCMAMIILFSPFAFSILMMGFIPAIMMFALLTSQFNIVGRHLFESYHTSVPNNT